MEPVDISQNVVLAVMAAPLLAALVDAVKRFRGGVLNVGMLPALIAELGGLALGALAFFSHAALYNGAPPDAPLATYLASGFVAGLGAVGLHAQFRSGFRGVIE